METIEIKLQNTRRTVTRESLAFVYSARKAATAFVAETAKATSLLGGVAQNETRSWAEYLAERGAAALPDELPKVELRAIERGLLFQLSVALDRLNQKVACRLARLGRGDLLPLQQYGTLTARAIVTQLNELSDAECATVLAFEQANKKRTTVVRAIELRLAA